MELTASKKEADLSLMVGGDSIHKVNETNDLLLLHIGGYDEDSIIQDLAGETIWD